MGDGEADANEIISMSQSEETNRFVTEGQAKRTAKKPYNKPAVRYERVFETSALTCGKVTVNQGECHFNRKVS